MLSKLVFGVQSPPFLKPTSDLKIHDASSTTRPPPTRKFELFLKNVDESIGSKIFLVDSANQEK